MTTPRRRDVYTRIGGVDNVGMPFNMDPHMTRATNSMSYREFIVVLKHLWENAHPEIKVMPTQGPAFAQYPVITYSLELRKTVVNEPKKRYREEIVDQEDVIYSIYGQRFQNLIAFSAITRNDPELSEAIIETFQLFMDEHVGTLKELGTSEIVFSRRMSDRDENRTAEDVAIRTIAYLVTLEHVQFVRESKLESIAVDIRMFLDNQRAPGFTVTAGQVGTNEITVLQNNLEIEVGDFFLLKSIDNAFFSFPGGILNGHTYEIIGVTTDDSATPSICRANIRHRNGNTVNLLSTGTGAMLPSLLENYDITITDQLAEGATPSI